LVPLLQYTPLFVKLSLPFVFPGSKQQYHGLTDVTDSGLLAEHLFWEATESRASNEAFNVVNGDIFRWKYMWKVIADYFKLDAAPYQGEIIHLQQTMNSPHYEQAWASITQQHNLHPHKLSQIASWWHADADLGRNVECINDMNKSKELGFIGFRYTEKAIIGLFDRLRKEKIIP